MSVDQSLKEITDALLQGGFDGTDKRLTAFLTQFGITTHNLDGSWRGTGELLKEIARVYNTIQND